MLRYGAIPTTNVTRYFASSQSASVNSLRSQVLYGKPRRNSALCQRDAKAPILHFHKIGALSDNCFEGAIAARGSRFEGAIPSKLEGHLK